MGPHHTGQDFLKIDCVLSEVFPNYPPPPAISPVTGGRPVSRPECAFSYHSSSLSFSDISSWPILYGSELVPGSVSWRILKLTQGRATELSATETPHTAGVLESVYTACWLTGSARTPHLPSLCSVTCLWWLEIRYGGRACTAAVSKCSKPPPRTPEPQLLSVF